MIEVVSAVIIQAGRVLLQQRDPARSDFGWLWESPGGKVEPGEAPTTALAREGREELGVELHIRGVLRSIEFKAGGEIPRPCVITFYDVSIAQGSPKPMPLAGVGLGYFSVMELHLLKMTPANERFREELCALIRSRL